MKKVLLKIFTFVLALCCLGLVACGDKEEGPKATLVGFDNSTVEISYGMNYNLAEYVFDSEGNRYELSVTVTDSDGQSVTADSFFQVVKASYKVVYTVDFKGESKSCTVTVKGLSTPTIELGDNKEQTYTIGILPAELPAINASDLIDGKITNITKEVYKQTSYENKKMEDYDGVSNYYVPKSVGTYYWKITVTNSNGQSNTRLLYFYVTADPGVYDLECYDGGETMFKTAKAITYDYVTASEFPTAGISNEVNYDGPAYKLGNVPHNASITVDLGYTAREYLALEAQGKFNAVQFYYMIDSTRHPSRTSCGNNDQRLPDQLDVSFNDNWSFFSGAGYYAIRKNAESSTVVQEGRYITTNQWQLITVPVSDFVKTLGTGKTGELITTFMFGSTDTVDIYLSAVKFVQYDWTKVPNKGAYGITLNENNYKKVTVSGQGATVDYVANADFPTEYEYKTADGLVTGTVANNIGYTGNAAKVYIPTNNKYVYVAFNYTGNEYLRLEAEGKFNAVKFTVMTESGYNNNETNMFAQAGFAKKSLIRGEWKTYVISIEDFVKAFENPDSVKACIYRSYLTNGYEHDFYVGDIEFITYDFNHEHTGGTASCTAKAICDVCGLEYGELLPHVGGTATCTVQAECDVCGKSYGELAPHVGGTATCIKLAECTVCGQEYGKFAEHTGGTATDCLTQAICDVCNEPYGAFGPHAENVEIPGSNPTATAPGMSAKISCTTCNQTISEQEEIPALNFVVNDESLAQVKVSSKTDVSIVKATELPEGIANTVGFSGDVIKVTSSASGRGIKLVMPYTGDQYKVYAQANGYTAVKLTYAITRTSSWTIADGCMINVLGNVKDSWTTVVLSLDDFVNTFGYAYKETATSSNAGEFATDTALNTIIIRTDAYSAGTWAFYFSDMEFITYDFSHEHTGGTASCTAKAVCTECGIAYGEVAPHTGGTATCTVQAECDVCGKSYGELAPHVGGTATCIKLAECTVCGQEYGEFGAHNEGVISAGTPPTATNPGTADISSCTVCGEAMANGEVLPAMNYIVAEDNVDGVIASGQGVNYEYVANSALPTEGIDNSVGYTGGAVKLSGTLGNGKYVYYVSALNKDQVAKYAQANGYNAVKVSLMYTSSDDKNLTNNSTTGLIYTMSGSTSARGSIARNKWATSIIDIDKYLANFSADDPNRVVILGKSWIDSGTWTMYVGNVEFITYDATHEHTGGEATCTKLAICDICYQAYGELLAHTGGTATCTAKAVCTACGNAYGELAPHTPVESAPAVLPTGTTAGTSAVSSCDVCGEVLTNAETLPAMNYVPASTDDAAKVQESASAVYTIEYVEKANLPTTVDNTIGYTGNAVKMQGADNINYFVELPYTPDQYRELAEKGAFNMVRFYIMIENGNTTYVRNYSINSPVAGGTGSGTWTMLSGAGYYSPKIVDNSALNLPLDKWICVQITLDDLCNSYNETYGYRVIRTRSNPKTNAEFSIYLGNVEFFDYHEHTGGTATCTELAKCDVCGESYGELAAHTGGTATCTVQAQCDVCGQSYGELLAHIGGFATCTEQAKCFVCGTAYGELGDHVEVYAITTQPTATTAGLASGTKCSVCDAPISTVETAIPALNVGIKDASFNLHSAVTKEVITAEKLPTEYDNTISFSGDMVKITASTNAKGAVINMPYTGAEIKAIAEANSYTKVRFTYLWVRGTASSPVAGTLLVANGATIANKVYTNVELTIDQFVGAFGQRTKPSSTASNYTKFESNSNSKELVIRTDEYGTWTLYLSDITFA